MERRRAKIINVKDALVALMTEGGGGYFTALDAAIEFLFDPTDWVRKLVDEASVNRTVITVPYLPNTPRSVAGARLERNLRDIVEQAREAKQDGIRRISAAFVQEAGYGV